MFPFMDCYCYIIYVYLGAWEGASFLYIISAIVDSYFFCLGAPGLHTIYFFSVYNIII